MMKSLSPLELSRLALEKSTSHWIAAKTLAGIGQFDFAVFHLFTALEEITKARLGGQAFHQLTVELGWGEDSAAHKALQKSVFSHPFKLPVGLLFTLLQAPISEIVEHPGFPANIPSEDAIALKATQTKRLEWVVENIDKINPDTREQALYSGPDRTGGVPQTVDWKDLYDHLGPLIESQQRFAKWAIEQTLTPADLEQTKASMLAMVKQLPPGGR